MKPLQIFILCCFCLLSSKAIKAQNYNGLEASVHLGIPTEDINDSVNLVYGIDFNYYFVNVAEVIELGITGGYINFNGEQSLSNLSINVALPDAGFFRFGGAGRFNFNSKVYFGLDLGYAIGLDDIEGGAYYQPEIGFYANRFSFFVYYQNMYTDARFPDYTAIGVGTNFHF